jgi:hypothetical protein
VDQVNWPETAGRLEAAAGGAVNTWVEAIGGIIGSGRKVLGFGSAASGEGVTTLMLIAARKLSGQGLRVVVVDADSSNPRLAQALGLLPPVGWEASICDGLPLAEVAIESLSDRLAVVPMLAAPRERSRSGDEASRAVADLDILARHYDVVLVDLGPLDAEAAGSPLAGPAGSQACRGTRTAAAAGYPRSPQTIGEAICRRLEALLLVQSVRTTTPDRIDALEQKLVAAGIVPAGIVQNFVAG